jgi:imidazolonepropionase-like amidohydrolase
VHAETAEEIADAVRFGATGVEHSAMAGALPVHLIESLAKAGTFVDPTFGEYVTAMTLDGRPESERGQAIAVSYAATQQMAGAGVRLAIGTDAPLVAYGTGLLDEMDHFIRAGFNASQVLTIATANNAAYLGQEGRLGCVRVKCAADLIVAQHNPLIDIKALRLLTLVLREGVPVVRRTN